MTQPLTLACAVAHAHHSVAWGDVPTWIAVIGAIIGAWVALRQFARQTRQLERQHRQAAI